MFGVIPLFVLVKSFVEFSKGIGNSFSRCDAFSFVALLFFAVLIPGTFRTPLNSSRILTMSCCLFILFFSLMYFFYAFAQVLQSLFSSLGKLLLSSLSFAAADVVTCASLVSFLNSHGGGLCSPPKGHTSRPRNVVVDELGDTGSETYDLCPARSYIDRSIFCMGLPWTPRLGIQPRGFDPDPPCAPLLRRNSSGVGSEEPRAPERACEKYRDFRHVW